MKLTEIAHFSANPEKMALFYEKLLGRPPVARSEGMAIFMTGGTKIFIHRTYDQAEGELPPENHHAYAVQNVDEACRRFNELGMKIEIPPADYYWGRSAYLRDPDGNLLEIVQEESS
jgi:catechol 2,3-dioxygenase-like lactoylglutathione lyase family enzyme